MDTSGKAIVSKSTFRFECTVGININAKPEKLWDMLTDAAGTPAWSTVALSISGTIALNREIEIKSVMDPTRSFKLKVVEFTPPARMVWVDGTRLVLKSIRTYSLVPRPDGTTDFFFETSVKGLMLPMISGSLAGFGPVFEQVAIDLKRAAEK